MVIARAERLGVEFNGEEAPAIRDGNLILALALFGQPQGTHPRETRG
jgi:hypothetical protein